MPLLWMPRPAGWQPPLFRRPANFVQLYDLSGAGIQVTVLTSAIAGCGTSGNVCLDLIGETAASGVLTLRNKGGSFRPAQVCGAADIVWGGWGGGWGRVGVRGGVGGLGKGWNTLLGASHECRQLTWHHAAHDCLPLPTLPTGRHLQLPPAQPGRPVPAARGARRPPRVAPGACGGGGHRQRHHLLLPRRPLGASWRHVTCAAAQGLHHRPSQHASAVPFGGRCGGQQGCPPASRQPAPCAVRHSRREPSSAPGCFLDGARARACGLV